MKEPVARPARPEQHDVKRRERRACASAGDERERDSSSLTGIFLRPSPRAREGVEKRRRQPRGRRARASSPAGVFVIAARIAEQVGCCFLCIAEHIAGFLGGVARGFSGFVLYAGAAECVFGGGGGPASALAHTLADPVFAVEPRHFLASGLESRRGSLGALAQRVRSCTRPFVELRFDLKLFINLVCCFFRSPP